MVKPRVLRSCLGEHAPATPVCPHFGVCGGCSFQDVAYPDQVRMKRAYVEALFDLPVEIVAAPEPYGYRQRMDYVFAFGKAGLRARGHKYDVIDLTACPLVPDRVFAAFDRLRSVAREHDIPDYDYRKHWGVLRYLVFRHAATTNQLLINVVASHASEVLAPLLAEAQVLADGVALCVTDQPADVSIAPVVQQFGAETLAERIGGMTFHFGPTTFAQNNIAVAERMYVHIVERCTGPTLDLYTGIGVVACLAARRAPRVWAVEVVEEAVALAERNAIENGITNVEFVCASTRAYLADFVRRECSVETIVCDPPRSGTAKKVCARMEALAPARILYVSCNPTVLQSELAWFETYKPVRLTAFDLFPQTPHVEVVAELVPNGREV